MNWQQRQQPDYLEAEVLEPLAIAPTPTTGAIAPISDTQAALGYFNRFLSNPSIASALQSDLDSAIYVREMETYEEIADYFWQRADYYRGWLDDSPPPEIWEDRVNWEALGQAIAQQLSLQPYQYTDNSIYQDDHSVVQYEDNSYTDNSVVHVHNHYYVDQSYVDNSSYYHNEVDSSYRDDSIYWVGTDYPSANPGGGGVGGCNVFVNQEVHGGGDRHPEQSRHFHLHGCWWVWPVGVLFLLLITAGMGARDRFFSSPQMQPVEYQRQVF